MSLKRTPIVGETLVYRDQPHLRAPVRWLECEVIEVFAAVVRVKFQGGGILRVHVSQLHELGATR